MIHLEGTFDAPSLRQLDEALDAVGAAVHGFRFTNARTVVLLGTLSGRELDVPGLRAWAATRGYAVVDGA